MYMQNVPTNLYHGYQEGGRFLKRIRSKIILLVMACVIFTAGVIGGVSQYVIYKTNNDRIDQLESQLRLGYDVNIKHQVEIIVSELAGVVNQLNKGVINKVQAEAVAADVVRNAKYGDSGYYWVDTLEGDNVVLLGNEAVEGTNRLGLEDHFGNKIVQSMIAIVKADGEGYYEYYFPKPNETEALPKRAYVSLFEPFGWVIGTGNYVDDIDAVVNAEREAMRKQMATSYLLLIIAIIGALLLGIIVAYIYSNTISKPILRLTNLLNKTSNLDIEQDSSYDDLLKYKDETGVIAHAVGNLRVVLRKLVEEMKSGAVHLNASSNELKEVVEHGKEGIDAVTHTVTDFATGASEQAEDAQKAAEKMGDLAKEIEETVQSAQKLKGFTKTVSVSNEEGVKQLISLNDKFKNTSVANARLNENVGTLTIKSSSIVQITNTIQQIAEQTNLLALNAAIEAARAGEAGRGFAVVADEIRKLAEETSKSTSKIDTIIQEILKEIDSTETNMASSNEAVRVSSDVLEHVQQAFEAIETAISDTLNQLDSISTSIQNVNASKDGATESIHGISAITEENAASAEEIAATMDTQSELMSKIQMNSNEVKRVADDMNEIIGRFKV